MRFGGTAGSGGTFGGVPELGWRFVSVAEAIATQSTLLSTGFSDQAANEIRCTVASGANNAGEVSAGGYMLFDLIDSRGRAVTTATNCLVEWQVIPVTAPANATFPYFVAGVTSKTTTGAMTAIPMYNTAGLNYQPATNPRGYYLFRAAGGALVGSLIGGAGGVAIGSTGGRIYANAPYVRPNLFLTANSTTIWDAANNAITGAPFNNVGATDASAANLKLIVAAGSLGGALAANTTIGAKVRYRLHRLAEDA
jgi:hypothetical protein